MKIKPKEYPRLRELREDGDYTQKEVAEYLGLHTTQYQRYERGESVVPAEIVIRLSKLYKVTVDYLLETPYTAHRCQMTIMSDND